MKYISSLTLALSLLLTHAAKADQTPASGAPADLDVAKLVEAIGAPGPRSDSQYLVSRYRKGEIESGFDQVNAELQEKYRLRPDKRFLYAISEISDILSPGNPERSIDVQFFRGHWAASAGTKQIGVLPETPTFDDFLIFLRSYRDTLYKQAPIAAAQKPVPATEIQAALDSYDPEIILEKLDSISKGSLQAIPNENLIAAAKLFIRLCTVFVDTSGISDQFYSRALAVLLIAEKRSNTVLRREEAELALAMDYSNFAEMASKALAESDPLRIYFNPNLEAVRRYALSEANLGYKFYYLRRLSKMGRMEDMNKAADEFGDVFDFGLTGPFFWRGTEPNFDSRQLNPLLVAVSNYYVEKWIGTAKPQSTSQTPGVSKLATNVLALGFGDPKADPFKDAYLKFETNLRGPLTKAQSKPETALLDTWTRAAFYRGLFYSGVYNSILFSGNFLGSDEAVKNLVSILEKRPGGYYSSHFFRIAQSHLREHIYDTLNEFEPTSPLGGTVKIDAFTRFLDRFPPEDNLKHFRKLLNSLDTRPNYEFELLFVCNKKTLNRECRKTYSQALLRNVVQIDGRPYSLAVIASGDKARIKALTEKENYSCCGTIELAHSLLESQSLTLDQYQKLIEDLVKRDPGNTSLRQELSSIYHRQLLYPEVIKLWEPFLLTRAKAQDLFIVNSRVPLAAAYSRQGQIKKALEAVLPAAYSGAADPLETAAILYTRDKQFTRAKEIVDRLNNRYPGSVSAVSATLCLALHTSNLEMMKNAFTDSRMSHSDWNEGLSLSIFFECLPSDAEAKTALSTLIGQHILDPTTVVTFSSFLLKRQVRLPLVTWMIDTFLPASFDNDKGELMTMAYKAEKLLADEPTANSWLKEKLKNLSLARMTIPQLYRYRQYSAVVNYIKNRTVPFNSQDVRMFSEIVLSHYLSGIDVPPNVKSQIVKLTADLPPQTDEAFTRYLISRDPEVSRTMMETPQKIGKLAFANAAINYFMKRTQDVYPWARLSIEYGDYNVLEPGIARELIGNLETPAVTPKKGAVLFPQVTAQKEIALPAAPEDSDSGLGSRQATIKKIYSQSGDPVDLNLIKAQAMARIASLKPKMTPGSYTNLEQKLNSLFDQSKIMNELSISLAKRVPESLLSDTLQAYTTPAAIKISQRQKALRAMSYQDRNATMENFENSAFSDEKVLLADRIVNSLKMAELGSKLARDSVLLATASKSDPLSAANDFMLARIDSIIHGDEVIEMLYRTDGMPEQELSSLALNFEKIPVQQFHLVQASQLNELVGSRMREMSSALIASLPKPEAPKDNEAKK